MHAVHSVCLAVSVLELIMLSTHIGNFRKWDFCCTNDNEKCDTSQTNESYKAKLTLAGEEN